MLQTNELPTLLADLEKVKQRLDKAANTVKEDHNAIYDLRDAIKDIKSQIVTSTEPTQSKEQDQLFMALRDTKRLIQQRFEKTASGSRGNSKKRGDIIDIYTAMFSVEVDQNSMPIKGALNALDANDLEIIQEPLECASRDLLKTTIAHVPSGQWRSSTMKLTIDNEKQNPCWAYGSGLTYAKKYALATIFNLHVGDE